MRAVFYLLIVCTLISCGGNQNTDVAVTVPTITNSEPPAPEDGFFPVTEYIKGQMVDIKNSAVNPLKKTGKDSSWVKIEELEKEFQPFLTPNIDTGNMKTFFRETKFLDKTINAYTFIYEPKVTLPDSMELRSWYVYVDPKKNNVKKIFMTKFVKGNQVHLTWESGKQCSIRTISEQPDGAAQVISEVLYQWDF